MTGSMLIDRVEGRWRSGRVTPGQHFAPGDGTVATPAQRKRAAAGEGGTGTGSRKVKKAKGRGRGRAVGVYENRKRGDAGARHQL